jgi:hypothetical protein
VLDDPHAGDFVRDGRGDLAGPVRRAVVDDDDLVLAGVLERRQTRGVDGLGDVRGLVEAREHDGQAG